MDSKQSELEQELALASGGLEDTKAKIAKFFEKSEMYCKDLERQILTQLKQLSIALDQPAGEYNPAELLSTGLEDTIQKAMKSIADRQIKIGSTIQGLNSRINDCTGRIASLTRNRDFQKRLLPPADAGLAVTQKLGQETTEERKRLDDAIANEICEYVNMKISLCTFVQDRRQNLMRTNIADARLAEQDETRRSREIEAVKEQIRKLEKDIKDEEDARAVLDQTRTDRYDERRKLEVKKELLQTTFKALKHWRDVSAGLTTDKELDKLKTEESRLQGRIDPCRNALKKYDSKTQKALTLYRSIYNDCIQEVLGTSYRGEVEENHGEIELSLSNRTARVSGEALDTLAIVLGDVSAQLACLNGQGCLPGLIIHDSPREADMAPSIYRSFLHFALALHHEFPLGEAPFQYIVTTTSAPPKELRGPDITKLKLDANKEKQMLLRVNYGIPALPLFENSDV